MQPHFQTFLTINAGRQILLLSSTADWYNCCIHQRWPIRLWKAAYSARLFGFHREFQSLKTFALSLLAQRESFRCVPYLSMTCTTLTRRIVSESNLHRVNTLPWPSSYNGKDLFELFVPPDARFAPLHDTVRPLHSGPLIGGDVFRGGGGGGGGGGGERWERRTVAGRYPCDCGVTSLYSPFSALG